MPRRPIEPVIQDLVYNLDVGVGLQIFRTLTYIFLVVAGVLLFTATQFFALGEPEAMEYAQLARSFSRSGTLTTQVIRPSTMRFLIENTGSTEIEGEEIREVGGDPRMESHPDILHPPVYPVILGAWFKLLRIDFEQTSMSGKYAPEMAIVILGHLFAVGTGLLIWLMGRLVFSRRVAFLAVTIYFLSNMVWTTSISGTNLTMAGFWVAAAWYFALLAAAKQEEESGTVRWLIPYVVTIVLAVVMVLTRYATVVLVPALALYVWIGFPRRGGRLAALFLVAFAVGLSPWLMRNVQVSGAPLGFLTESTLIGTRGFLDDSFERTLAPGLEELTTVETLETVQRKWFRNFEDVYRQVPALGHGLWMCLFFAMFFHRFVRPNVRQLRWCLLLAMVLMVVGAAYFTRDASRLLFLFWPFVILYGLAYYVHLMDRLNPPLAIQRLGITLLLVLLSALPLAMNLMRKGSYPYPPYLRPYVTYASSMVEPEDLLCTDMPWATAWYGERDSLLLPLSLDEFYDIHDVVRPIGGLYFTTLTRNQPYIRGLVLGKGRSWFPIQQLQIPSDFPLQHGGYLLDGDQLLLTKRSGDAAPPTRADTLIQEEPVGQEPVVPDVPETPADTRFGP